MNDPTSTHDGQRPIGHDQRGKFAKGNRFGRGNPLAGYAAKIRASLLKKMTKKVRDQVADKLIEMAIAGDVVCIRELYDRTTGKPAQTEVMERLERLEAQLNAREESSRIGGRN